MDETFEEVSKLIKWDENDALNMQFKIPTREEYGILASESDMLNMFNKHHKSPSIEIFITVKRNVHPTPVQRGTQHDEIFGVESDSQDFEIPMEAFSAFFEIVGDDDPYSVYYDSEDERYRVFSQTKHGHNVRIEELNDEQGLHDDTTHVLPISDFHVRPTVEEPRDNLQSTAMDGNSGLFTIAYAMVEGENGSSWHWFLECLHEAIGEINDARSKPIIYCIDAIWVKIMVKMNHKRQLAERWKEILVPEVQKIITELSKNKGMYDVHRSSTDREEVDGPEGRFDVILSDKTCSSAVICHMRGSCWEDYVDPCYTVARYRVVYAMPINPLPDKSMWEVEDLNYVVNKPPRQLRSPPGRPRKKRIRPQDKVHPNPRQGGSTYARDVVDMVIAKEPVRILPMNKGLKVYQLKHLEDPMADPKEQKVEVNVLVE
ncbi:hypothetical protein QJS10_CPA03g01419 [Acorus calamus]|uniref:MULE transposase domain-containing protein n=1 Tax=Acorus calamus TaxID=4465 RepID=A0AAV9F3Z9_ACOCL|nr:hypothetical protein QJS10_CPA03g01419 [Acorus calamus]